MDFTLVYILVLTASIYSLACLNLYTFPGEYSMEVVVAYTSLTMVSFYVYYVLYHCVCVFLPISWLWKRRDHGNSDYNDIHIPDHTITYGRPRLYMKDVWLFVYGVGFSYYVIGYVMVCKNLLCTQSYTLGLFILVFVEVCRQGWSPRNMIYCGAAILVLVGTMIKGSGDGYVYISNMFDTKDLATFTYGVVGPLISSCVIVQLDSNKKYTIGGIYELCELGFPFACILSTFPIIVFRNLSGTTLNYDINHLCLTALISPIPLLIVIVFIVEAMLKSHILDVLLSFSLASSVFELVVDGTNTMSLVAITLSVAAFVIRMSLLSKLVLSPTGNVQETSNVIHVTEVSTTTNLKMAVIDEDDTYDDLV